MKEIFYIASKNRRNIPLQGVISSSWAIAFGAIPLTRSILLRGLICQIHIPRHSLVLRSQMRTRKTNPPTSAYGPTVKPHDVDTIDQYGLCLAKIKYPWKRTTRLAYNLKIRDLGIKSRLNRTMRGLVEVETEPPSRSRLEALDTDMLFENASRLNRYLPMQLDPQ